MNVHKLFPSTLSSLRIVLAFLLFYCYLNEMRVLSVFIFTFALFTDYFDGFIARKLDVTSNSGAYLDITADFILVITVFSAFTVIEIYPYWILILITFMFVQFILTSGIDRPIYDPIGKYYGSFLFACAGITLILPLNYINEILTFLILLISSISLLTRFLSLYKKD